MKKTAYLISLVFLANSGWAQTCKPTSTEMQQYQNQSAYHTKLIPGEAGVEGVAGYEDADGRFYFDDLSRRGKFAARVEVNPNNPSYKDFFKYCEKAQSNGRYLTSMRWDKEGNQYGVSVRYLPNLSGLKNNPFKDQKFQDTNTSVQIKFSDKSIVGQSGYSSSEAKRELQKALNKQLESQPELGVLQFDLTNWDDVVCDLVNGEAEILVAKDGISLGPVVEVKQKIAPLDVSELYSALRSGLLGPLSRDIAIFKAARIQLKLEVTRRTENLDEREAFGLLQKLMTPEMDGVATLDAGQMSCLIDQMQTYTRPTKTHYMSIQLQFPKLEEIRR